MESTAPVVRILKEQPWGCLSSTAARWPPGPSCWAVPAGLLRQWRVHCGGAAQQARFTVCGSFVVVCSRDGARRTCRQNWVQDREQSRSQIAAPLWKYAGLRRKVTVAAEDFDGAPLGLNEKQRSSRERGGFAGFMSRSDRQVRQRNSRRSREIRTSGSSGRM